MGWEDLSTCLQPLPPGTFNGREDDNGEKDDGTVESRARGKKTMFGFIAGPGAGRAVSWQLVL